MSRHLFFEMRLVLMRLEQMDFNAEKKYIFKIND